MKGIFKIWKHIQIISNRAVTMKANIYEAKKETLYIVEEELASGWEYVEDYKSKASAIKKARSRLLDFQSYEFFKEIHGLTGKVRVREVTTYIRDRITNEFEVTNNETTSD